MKIIETERLVIEEAMVADAPFFHRLLNSPGWLTHIGDRNIKSEKDAGMYVSERLIKSYAENGFGLYVMRLKESNEAIGICGFVKRDYLSSADLGFALLPDYEGKGYMLEAAENLVQYGFSTLSFTEILAITSLTNNKSKQLLLKLGFKNNGTSQPDKSQPPVLMFSIQKTQPS